MNEFTAVLRVQVDQATQAMATAKEARHDYEVQRHVARIRDLLDMAARHGIDTSDWVDPATLDHATLGAS